LRWVILLREIFFLIPFVVGVCKLKKNCGAFDIIHLNDIVLLPAAWILKRFFPHSRIVIHARAVQSTNQNWRWFYFYKHLKTIAHRLIAIDQNVRDSLPSDLPVQIIHNGLKRPTSLPVASSLRIFTAAMVGMLSKSKGCDTFVDAAKICHQKGMKFKFQLFGDLPNANSNLIRKLAQMIGLQQDIGTKLKEIVERENLGSMVEFLPFNSDLSSIYSKIDVLCFPSHLDAPGRPIFEAAHFGIPSIAAISSPKADTFVNEVTGLIIDPGRPDQLANAIEKIYLDPNLKSTLGTHAQDLARTNFDADINAAKVLELYKMTKTKL
jgi:glycosyltransferase involved in cell wall biosynthesis